MLVVVFNTESTHVHDSSTGQRGGEKGIVTIIDIVIDFGLAVPILLVTRYWNVGENSNVIENVPREWFLEWQVYTEGNQSL